MSRPLPPTWSRRTHRAASAVLTSIATARRCTFSRRGQPGALRLGPGHPRRDVGLPGGDPARTLALCRTGDYLAATLAEQGWCCFSAPVPAAIASRAILAARRRCRPISLSAPLLRGEIH